MGVAEVEVVKQYCMNDHPKDEYTCPECGKCIACVAEGRTAGCATCEIYEPPAL